MQIIIFCGRRKLFCPEIILSCDAVPPTFIRSVSRSLLQGSARLLSALVWCPRFNSVNVSLLCHPASALLSTTTTQRGGNVSQESWYRLFWTAGCELLYSRFWSRIGLCDWNVTTKPLAGEARKQFTECVVTNPDGPKLSSLDLMSTLLRKSRNPGLFNRSCVWNKQKKAQ